jgi:hypothetical protein
MIPGLYRADIDGLRAFAVLSVLAHHLSDRVLSGGNVDVDVVLVSTLSVALANDRVLKICVRVHMLGIFDALAFVSIVVAVASCLFVVLPCRHTSKLGRNAVFSIACDVSVELASTSVWALLNRRILDGFSCEALVPDANRTQNITFRRCSKVVRAERCKLGHEFAEEISPTRRWRDSHMLTLAPVVDATFRDRKERASLAVASECPPTVRAVSNR